MPTEEGASSEHYEVLGLSPSNEDSEPGAQTSEDQWQKQLKTAFQRALKRHHPDKRTASANGDSPQYTVDQVRAAYAVLSSPQKRREYHVDLRRRIKDGNLEDGIESLNHIDLDDMIYSPEQDPLSSQKAENAMSGSTSSIPTEEARVNLTGRGGVFSAECPRCRSSGGIRVREAQLVVETESIGSKKDGRVVVSCQGCTLRVVIEYIDMGI